MKKGLEIAKTPAKKVRSLRLSTIVIAIALLAIGAVTVVSRQLAKVNERPDAQEKGAPVANAANRNYVTVKVAGRDVQVDSETGQIKELTPEEVAKLAAGLKQMINQSTDGLEQVQQSDGSVTMDLKGRFSSVTVARINEDGTLSDSCVDNAHAAGEFFGIDPKLIDKHAGNTSRRRPVTPANSQNQ